MKKIISLFIAALMCFSCIGAMAETVRIPVLGVTDMAFGGKGSGGAQDIAQNTAGLLFKTDGRLRGVNIRGVSWGDNIGNMTVSVHKWEGNYIKSIASKPVAEKEFVNFPDRSDLIFEFAPQPAGEYLLFVHGGTQKCGVWMHSQSPTPATGFFNGEQVAQYIQCSVMCEPAVVFKAAETVHTEPRSAYEKIPAADFDGSYNITVKNISAAEQEAAGSDKKITGRIAGIAKYDKIDFGNTSPKGVKLGVWCGDFSQMHQVHIVLDDPMNKPVAVLQYEFDRIDYEWETYPAAVTEEITGVHDVYLITRGDFNDVQISWFEFTKENPGLSPVEQRLVDFKADKIPEYTDTYADTWVATDMVGRKLPGHETVGDYNPDKQVGMFYWTWHVNVGNRTTVPNIINYHEINEKYPEIKNDYHASQWAGAGGYIWNESIYGVYTNYDEWVIRKQMELLESAGVDALFCDTSNGHTYNTGAMKVFKVMHQMHMEGTDTPKFSFLFPFANVDYNTWDIQNIYEVMYQPGLYSDCWYYWEGKPVLMAIPDGLEKTTGYDDVDSLYKEMLDYFTFRPGQADYRNGPHRENCWPWLEVYPQHAYGKSEKYGCECVSVGIAQNADDNGLTSMNGEGVYGRSFTYKDRFSLYSENSKLYGYNFQEQWSRAFELDPEFVFITGWNEYRAGRHQTWRDVPNASADQFNDEYSRDIEPTKGDLKDVYYYQLVANIRKFKGVRPTPVASEEKAVDINGGFEQWNDVKPDFIGIRGGTENRDSYGYEKRHYTNTTGRNDIVLSKVARDDENLYFYVETAENLTPYTDSDWMRLFINTDRLYTTGWEGYDFVVNNVSPSADKAVIQKHTGGEWNWENVAELDYKVSGKQMMIKIPKSVLGVSGSKVDIEFKWNDNMQIKGDLIDFYINGDTAPIGRFNYRYVTDTSGDKTPKDELVIPQKAAADLLENHTVMKLGNPVALHDGEKVAIDSANPNITPKIINDKTMVPLRFVTESLGATVTWDDATQSATITKDGKRVKVTVGSAEMRIEREKKKLQTPAQLIDDRIFVPLRDVSEAFGTQVFWQDPDLVIVGDNANTIPYMNDELLRIVEINMQ